MKQETFTDVEYSFRIKKTKREKFLETMDEIIPWDKWVSVIEPCEQMLYPDQCGQIDVKFVPAGCLAEDAAGQKFYQYTFIDKYS